MADSWRGIQPTWRPGPSRFRLSLPFSGRDPIGGSSPSRAPSHQFGLDIPSLTGRLAGIPVPEGTAESEPPKRDGHQSGSGAPRLYSHTTKTGTGVMLSFARVLDRVRPQASLAIALLFSVAWIAALDYGLLRLVW